MRRLDEVPLNETDRLAIREAAEVLRARLPVEQIILFGSKARGADDEESDIDLLVLTSRPLSWPQRCEALDALFPLQLKHDVVFSPLQVWSKDWYEGLYQVLPIRAEVDRDGVAA